MHQVQKKAALAILSMVEAGLRELRLMLTDQSVPDSNGHTIIRQRQEPAYGSPLNDEEEASLDHVMEHNRQEMIRQAASMTETFFRDPVPTAQSFYDEEGS